MFCYVLLIYGLSSRFEQCCSQKRVPLSVQVCVSHFRQFYNYFHASWSHSGFLGVSLNVDGTGVTSGRGSSEMKQGMSWMVVELTICTINKRHISPSILLRMTLNRSVLNCSPMTSSLFGRFSSPFGKWDEGLSVYQNVELFVASYRY